MTITVADPIFHNKITRLLAHSKDKIVIISFHVVYFINSFSVTAFVLELGEKTNSKRKNEGLEVQELLKHYNIPRA